jgi:hypothetical protein
MKTEERKGQGQEIIGCAYFSVEKAILPILVVLLLLAYFVYGSYETFLKRNYTGVLIFFIADLATILFLVDYLLSDRIIFYRNRVTKTWRVLGSRTIYYSNAKVFRNEYSTHTDTWIIGETEPAGKPLFLRLPICYGHRLYLSDKSEEILSILTDLTDKKTEDFWANKSERRALIIFGLFSSILVGFLVFGTWYYQW